MIEFTEYAKLLVALLAILDVPGNVPVFLQQTARLSSRDRLITALTAGVATAVILMLFASFGEAVLQTFGITIAAFKILGGIVVLLIALDMLGLLGGGETASAGKQSDAHPVSIGIFPMAVPLFAGPGSITAVMVYAHEEFHSAHDLIVTLVILSAAMVATAGLSVASTLGRFLGAIAQSVLNRLLGMIVGALGVEFILEGIAAYFPGLAA